MFSFEFCEISKDAFFYRTPLGVAASAFFTVGKILLPFLSPLPDNKIAVFFNMILLNRKHIKSINQEQLVNVVIICNKSNTFQKFYGAF